METNNTPPLLQKPPIVPQTLPVGTNKRIHVHVHSTPMFETTHRPRMRVSLRETAIGPVSRPYTYIKLEMAEQKVRLKASDSLALVSP